MRIDPRYLPTIGSTLDAPMLELELRDLLGGQVDKVHAALLEDNQAVTIRNMFTNRGCLVERRPGITDVMTGVSPSGAILGLGWWNPPVSPPSPRLVAVAQNGIFDWSGSGSWRLISGGSFSGTNPVYFAQVDTLATGLTNDTNLLIMQKGATTVYQYDGTTTLSTVSGGSWGSDTSVPVGNCVISWRGQTWVATNDGYIRYSEFGIPTRFDVMSNWLMDAKDPPERIVEWLGAGILCFNRNSIQALEIDQGNFDVLLFDSTRRVTLNHEIGCIAGKSVAQAGQDFYFLSREGVMQLSKTLRDGAVGQAVALSEPIRETIRRINWSQAHRSCGVVWDNKYLLAIPVDGSSDTNLVVAYDLLDGGWSEIVGWNIGDFRLTNFAADEDRVYGGTSLTAGAGETYELFDPDVDTDDGVAIDAHVVTKRFDFGSKTTFKLFHSIDVYSDATSGGEVEVYAAADNNDFSLVGTITITSAGVGFDWEFPLVFPPETVQLDTFPLCGYGHVREMQFKIVATGEAQTRILQVVAKAYPAGSIWS